MLEATQEEDLELKKIADFRKGYQYFISGFQTLIAGFLQFVSSGAISESNKRDLLPYRKAIDHELEKAQKKLKEISVNLDEKHMYVLVKKEYSRYFTRNVGEANREDFVQFHITFEMLRFFYIESREGWEYIRKSVSMGKFNDPEFQNSVLLTFRIYPTIERLNQLEIFLKRMGFILKIDNPNFLTEFKPTKPTYNENTVYRLSSIFEENLYAKSEKRQAEEDDLSYFGVEGFDDRGIKQEIKDEPSAVKKAKPTVAKKEVVVNYIQAYGKYSWNSDLHYYFRYELDKYNQEKEFFKTTINMDLHLGADEQVLRSEMIRSLTSAEKKSKSATDIEIEYLSFLNSFFGFCENIVLMSMAIPPQFKWVFFFHLGPSHFYMIAKKFLTEVGTGFLHVKSSDGKKVTRVIPSEVVKKHVIDYWNEMVLPNVGEEKNNLALLKKITEMIEDKYKEISAHTIQKYDELDQSIKDSKPRVQIFREYMNEWMGAANIIVFKRFVKNKSY